MAKLRTYLAALQLRFSWQNEQAQKLGVSGSVEVSAGHNRLPLGRRAVAPVILSWKVKWV